MMASGDSERGLSDVIIVTSDNCDATRPISGRFEVSLSPPQPKTVTMRLPGLSERTSLNSRRSPSGVWA